jgi:hypothetical protein
VYWKVLEPSELLEYDSQLVAFTQELPFQEGKPLSSISKEGEGSTELLEYNHMADNSLDRQVYMASLLNRMMMSWVLSTTLNYSRMTMSYNCFTDFIPRPPTL